ncbi:hypothetical protein EEJ31_07095 [Cryobacterium tepidiphilum]|uniref:Uncharacterized protein n=2 Tax=Cryobacterium tepidiphilum TaxID=2486026 RepID=A0A3M8LCS0_9MICO|nr:hypothetical protein EEJ31_07095 [Cryobacterium tepidiphilum]
MLWTGVVLTVIGVIARTFLLTALASIWGNGALNNAGLYWAYTLLAAVCFELGLALVAFSLVARSFATWRSVVRTSDDKNAEAAAGDASAGNTRASAVMFWVGVALAVLGLILQYAPNLWAFDLSGGADVGSRLATDILTVIGPLQMLAFPLGILLVAGALVVRTLEPTAAETQRALP